MKNKQGIAITVVLFVALSLIWVLSSKKQEESVFKNQINQKGNEATSEAPEQVPELKEIELGRNTQYVVTATSNDPEDALWGVTSFSVTELRTNTTVLTRNFSPHAIFNQGFKWIDDASFMLGGSAAPPYFFLRIFHVPSDKDWQFNAITVVWPTPDKNGSVTFLTETEASKKQKPSQEWRDGLPLAIFEKVIYRNGNIIYTGEFEEEGIQ